MWLDFGGDRDQPLDSG